MQTKRIFVLTGAGVSAESGLGTFRDPNGLWLEHSLEDLATPEGFARNPRLVHDFYNGRRAALLEAKPNGAHIALARLEKTWERLPGGAVTICTQNIDDLHERAGSFRVAHMHGELKKARCGACGAVTEHLGALSVETACTACGAAGALRPHVVWFGEEPLLMDFLMSELLAADLFVSIGTSGAVYPAAGFVAEAQVRGAATMELNLAPSDNAYMFDKAQYGPASVVVPIWVDEMIASLAR